MAASSAFDKLGCSRRKSPKEPRVMEARREQRRTGPPPAVCLVGTPSLRILEPLSDDGETPLV